MKNKSIILIVACLSLLSADASQRVYNMLKISTGGLVGLGAATSGIIEYVEATEKDKYKNAVMGNLPLSQLNKIDCGILKDHIEKQATIIPETTFAYRPVNWAVNFYLKCFLWKNNIPTGKNNPYIYKVGNGYGSSHISGETVHSPIRLSDNKTALLTINPRKYTLGLEDAKYHLFIKSWNPFISVIVDTVERENVPFKLEVTMSRAIAHNSLLAALLHEGKHAQYRLYEQREDNEDETYQEEMDCDDAIIGHDMMRAAIMNHEKTKYKIAYVDAMESRSLIRHIYTISGKVAPLEMADYALENSEELYWFIQEKNSYGTLYKENFHPSPSERIKRLRERLEEEYAKQGKKYEPQHIATVKITDVKTGVIVREYDIRA